MTTRIVFKDRNIERENLVEDLDTSFVKQTDVESLDDDNLGEAWIYNGVHKESWVWERIYTDNSAPSWGWVVVDEEDAQEIKREISVLGDSTPDQLFSCDTIENYLSDLKQGLKAFEQGRKLWINWDDDGIHLGIQEGMNMAWTRGGVSW